MPYLRAFAAHARFLDAAEGRHLGRDQALVDADHAVFQRLGRPGRRGRGRGCRNSRRGRIRCRWPCAIASASVSKRNSGASGPKVSSRATAISGVAPASTVGSKNVCRRARGACRRRRPWPPLATRVGDMLLDLGDRLVVDQRALLHAVLRRPLPTLSLPAAAASLLGESVVDAGLDVEAVGADAGLAGVAELGGDRALDRAVEVGVVEDDERRVAAQLHRDLLDRLGRTARISILPTSVEPVKVILRTVGLEVSSAPISPRRAGDDVEHARGNAGPLGTARPRPGPNRASALAGLTTMVQPAASAGPILRAIIEDGKFQGVIAATTPDRLLDHQDAPARPGRAG